MSWLFNARRYKLDFQTRFKNLENRFNAKITDDSADEGEDLQTSTEGNIGKSYLKFCDFDLSSVHTIAGDASPSMLAFEPDYDTCRLYVEMDSLGEQVSDYSSFGHTAKTVGVGRVHNGIDYGFAQSTESIFDGRSCYAEIADHDDLKISTISTGYSLFFRFLPFSLDQSGGYNQVVVSKIDTPTVDWWSFELFEDGKAAFNMEKSDTIYSIVTPSSLITPVSYANLTTATPRYDVGVTFDEGTDTLKLFVNNTKYDTVNSSLQTGSQSPSYTESNTKINIGRWTDTVSPAAGEKYASRSASKLYHGVFQQLKFFKDKVVTEAEVGYHYTNKCTIANIPFGQVASPGTMVFDT